MRGKSLQHELPPVDTLDSRQFVIAVKRLADSLSYGTDRSPYVGSGVEFAQSRPYVWGDPIKSIDWRVTARTGKVHVKEYETPKRMPVYLLVDTSASMMVASGSRSKYSLAVQIAGGLAMACLDRISPVGVMGIGERALHIRPSLSVNLVMQWLHRLRAYRYDERTCLAERLLELAPSLTQRVLFIVLSDMHAADPLSALARIRQQHDCCVVQLRDPAETELRGAGWLRAREAETGAHFTTHGHARWVDSATVARQLKRARIDHLPLEVGRPFVHRLRHFFESRSLLGRKAR